MGGLRELDRVLRGEVARAPGGTGPAVALGPLVTANLLLAAFYGVCMGVYGIAGRPEPEYRQMLADAVKVPLLFSLTLFVTFPSLYVFTALTGSHLRVGDLARLTAAGIGVTLAVLAAFGPIVAFFSVTTTSYPFVVLLNVAVFTLAAGFGIAYLTRTIEHMLPRPGAAPPAVPPELEGGGGEPPVFEIDPAPAATSPASTRTVLYVWLVVFALVGAQMSWVLRPFIGSPTQEFTWFRGREASFFEAVLRAAHALFAG